MGRSGHIESLDGAGWRRINTALLIAAGYIVLGAAWIVVSGKVSHAVSPTPEHAQRLETIKGIGFVVATGIMLFVLIDRALRARERMGRAALEAERKFRATFEHAAVGIGHAGTDGKWVMVNDRFCEMLGYTREEMLGMTISAVTHPADRAESRRLFEAALAGEHSTYTTEKRYVRKDGGVVWALVTPSLVRDEAGRALYFIGVVQDISDRKRAEAALAESGRVLEQAQAVGRIGSWTVDPRAEGGLQWSAEVHRIFGLRPEEFDGRVEAFFARVHPEDREMVREASRAAVAGEMPYSIDHRIVRPDGTVRWVHEQAEIERDSSGAAVRMIGVVQDITERAEAEAFGKGQRRVLEMIASGASLARTADEIVRVVEEQSSGARGSILTVDGEGAMRTLSAPGLPREYCRAIDGVKIGPRVGSCGTAMHAKRRVIVRDIASDELWGEFKSLAAEYGLGACWSEPVVSSDGKVLGSLALYFESAREPTGRELDAITTAAHLAGIAIERALGEMALKASEQRLALAMQGGRLGVFDWDMVSGKITWSEEHARLWGMRLEEFDGSYAMFASRVHPADLAGIEAHVRAAIEGSGEYIHEYRLNLPDGTVRWVQGRGHVERNESRPVRMRGVVADVTDRRNVEEALRASEATKRALLDAIPDLMFRVDRKGMYLDYHAPDSGRLIAPPERFLGRTVREVLTEERAERCMRHVEAMFQTGQAQTYEYDVRRPDGTRAWWEVRVVRSGEDEALLLLRDITDRRQAERRLRESEQRLRLLVENTPLAVVQWGTDFTVSSWNPGAERTFGHSAAEALGRHASFIVPESARKYVDDLWRDLMSNRGGFRAANQNVRKDGTLVWCEWYNSPLVDATGKVFAVASVVEDVTERRNAEQRQDLMMAELDHRVKNNLAAVISLAEQTGRSATGYKEFADKFMGRLRAMSRMHSVLARSRWQGADLLTLVTQTLEAFGSGSAGRATAQGPSLMLGPRAAQAMAMALNELATNAVKYGALSAPEGRVEATWTVETMADGGRQLRFAWVERGGPAVKPPERRGFGSELIEGTIAYELRGKVELKFEPSGVVCEMMVPLTEETQEGAGVVVGADGGEALREAK